MAKVIMGIEKPSAGKILFNGEDITDKDITERAKMGIGFAFQQPVRFKGIQVIDLIRLATGRTIKTEEACKYLSEVGLNAQEYIEREVNSSLSGGELKRIEIASVLAKAPKLSVFILRFAITRFKAPLKTIEDRVLNEFVVRAVAYFGGNDVFLTPSSKRHARGRRLTPRVKQVRVR